MWTCQKCGENIDEAADVCWNCGTSKAGVEDPTFHRPDAPGVDGEPPGSSEGRLDEDLACRTCGCKLRGVRRDSVCPECGTAVNWSPHGDLLRFSDPAWVRALASGMGWIVAGAVCSIILGLYAELHYGALATWLFGIRRDFSHGFPTVPGIPATLMFLIGCWMVTRPDAGRTDAEGAFAARKLARVWMITAFLWIAVWAQLTLAAALPLDYLFVQVLGVAVGLLTTIALLAYARQLALRLPSKQLAIDTQILKWGIAMMLVVPPMQALRLVQRRWFRLDDWLELLAALGGVILLICVLVLIVRYWIALHKTAAQMVAATGSATGPGRIRFRTREIVRVAGMVCALLAIWGGVAFFWSYQQISQLKERLRDEDPLVRRNAVGAFWHYGRAAVRPLVDALEDEDPEVRESAAVSSILTHYVGRAAVPALIDLLNDKDARLRRWGATPPIHGHEGQTPALFFLLRQGLTGPDSTLRGNRKLTAALSAALEDEDEVIRFYAASALPPDGSRRERGKLEEGSGGKPLSFWIAHLKHQDPNVRLWAAYYVVRAEGDRSRTDKVRPEAKAAVPVLIELLKHKDFSIRRWATETLGEIGPDAKEAVPALAQSLVDKKHGLRHEAIQTLARIGRRGDFWGDSRLIEAALPALIEALKAEDPSVRWSAAQALGRIGPDAEAAVPALIEALKDKHSYVRWFAAEALGGIGPDAEAAVPALVEALNDKKTILGNRSAVTRALAQIGPAAKEVVPALTRVLSEKDNPLREPAAEALGVIGPDASQAIPALVEALKDEEVRGTAAEALAKIGPKAIPALINAARDQDPRVREFAILALGKMGPDASQTVPMLIDALQSKDASIRAAAAVSLGLLGPSAKEAIPRVIQTLEGDDRHLRVHAADALRRLGWQHKEKLLPVLIEALKDDDACCCAAAALSEFGSEASEAVPALLDLLKDARSPIRFRLAAKKALKKIDPKAAAEAGLK